MNKDYVRVNELYREKAKPRCAVCGRYLDKREFESDYVVSFPDGEELIIERKELVCRMCNRRKGAVFSDLLGYQFEGYISQLLELHPLYTVVNDSEIINNEGWDLHFRRGNKEEFIAEIKVSTSYTRDRIQRIIYQLCEYKQKRPGMTIVFITFGELPGNYVDLLVHENIVVWDRNFLIKEFLEQIKQTEDSYFSQLLLDGLSEESYDKYVEAIKELKSCSSGRESWGKYQRIIEKILGLLFVGELEGIYVQNNDEYGKNRRDYVLANYAQGGIWYYLRERYCADYIVIDAKNSGKNIQKSDMLQVGHYLKEDGVGLFGIIIARKGMGDPAKYAQRELWMHDKKMVVVLNDDDIEQMLLEKKNGNDPVKIIRKKIEDFRLAI